MISDRFTSPKSVSPMMCMSPANSSLN